MSGQHTPGPWQVQLASEEPDESGLCIIGLRTDEHGVPYHTPTNGLVSVATQLPSEIDEGDYTRCQANARLIAQAPQLLADLIKAERMFRWYGDLHAAKPDPEKAARNYEMADRLAATIAAATGGAA